MAQTNDHEIVSIYPFSDEEVDQLMNNSNECVLMWATKDGWPVGVGHRAELRLPVRHPAVEEVTVAQQQRPGQDRQGYGGNSIDNPARTGGHSDWPH